MRTGVRAGHGARRLSMRHSGGTVPCTVHHLMRAALAVGLLVCACDVAPFVPWPERAPCAEDPSAADIRERTVTFPPRDFVCAEPERPARDGDPQVCETVVPLRDEDQRSVAVGDELGGATLVYLLDALSIPEATPDPDGLGSVAVGFDLDALDSGDGSVEIDADCQDFNQDFASPYEPSVGGVDNAFQGLLRSAEDLFDPRDCPPPPEELCTTVCGSLGCSRRCPLSRCTDALLRREVHDGVLLVLLEITGVDSFENDPEVEVAIYAGRTLDGARPRLTAESTDEGARVVADQRFETIAVIAPPARGDILVGRLRVRWPRVELPRERYGYPSSLLDVELRAGVCAHGLFDGHMGGAATVDSLVEQAAEVAPVGSEATIRSILESIADLQPRRDRWECDRISVAYALEGVPAIRAR